MSDGVAVVVWDEQWEMKPAPAPGLLQHPRAGFTWLLVQGAASGEVWVDLAMGNVCIPQMDLCGEGRKKGYPVLPALSWQSRTHPEMF